MTTTTETAPGPWQTDAGRAAKALGCNRHRNVGASALKCESRGCIINGGDFFRRKVQRVPGSSHATEWRVDCLNCVRRRR